MSSMNKKEIEDWIKAFNQRQFERMKEDEYEDYIDEDDINGCERFRGGGEWEVELIAPQAVMDLLPEWESSCWWEVPIMIDPDDPDVEGYYELEHEALDEYGVKSIDEINAHFARRYYKMTDEETKWWGKLEEQIKGKTGLPFEEIRFMY